MAKSSRPDRKRGDRRNRTPSEYDEVTLSVDRVTRVVAGGRRMRFRAIVVIGNKKGKVGLGTGKAAEVQAAVKKATVDAKRHMVRIPLREGTIPHEVNVKYKAAKVRLLPACKGTGVIAGGAVRVVLEQAGVQDVLSKRFGSSNKLVNAQAVMKALGRLKWKGGMPSEDTTEKKPLKETEGARQDAAALEGERLGVTEVSKKDVVESKAGLGGLE
ncbi:MAG: 30S ribosomal protein S5 [Candidatus Peribacteraceae bacterium]|jgi:small subunit ribosomal protein S5|nr:30S ribosomal protein S5 [Candidatus Peribacteraceae bacterium]